MEDTFSLRCRFDKEELPEIAGVGCNSDTYSAHNGISSQTVQPKDGAGCSVLAAEIVEQYLDWLAKSDKVGFDLGGYATATIELEGAKEAVADFTERMEKLKRPEDEEEELEQEDAE